MTIKGSKKLITIFIILFFMSLGVLVIADNDSKSCIHYWSSELKSEGRAAEYYNFNGGGHNQLGLKQLDHTVVRAVRTGH